MVSVKKIDQAEVARIFALPESHYLDVKRVEIMPAKLSESVSAFANTAGGELFVGIGEKENGNIATRFWNGFKTQEDANAVIKVIEKMTPLGNHYSAEFLACDAQPGLVCHLVVTKTKDIVDATNGHPYIRRNAQNLCIRDEAGMQRLRLDKGIVSFEDEAVNTDVVTITNSKKAIEFILTVVPSAEPDEWMHKQNLVAKDKVVSRRVV
jgi:ATP-dependent DNA helicase RecG